MSEAWRNFCRQGTNWLGDGVIAVQGYIGPILTHGAGFKSKPLEQGRP
jgi:hypothetical protein